MIRVSAARALLYGTLVVGNNIRIRLDA